MSKESAKIKPILISIVLLSIMLSEPLFACSRIIPTRYILGEPNTNCQFPILLRDRNGKIEPSGKFAARDTTWFTPESGKYHPFFTKAIILRDCKHHIRHDSGGFDAAPGVSFYHLGEELHSYTYVDLVVDLKSIEYGPCGDLQWYESRDIDEKNNTYRLVTIDGQLYVFSLYTGEILEHTTSSFKRWWELLGK